MDSVRATRRTSAAVSLEAADVPCALTTIS
eukprot:COSAG02_NODE_38699_length_426_cov_0.633028_1_plen_29_part_10